MPRLLRDLKSFYKTQKRDLPWRHTHDPYKILVSEIMLQQTQALRVIPKYEAFIKKFPTPQRLAKAKLSDVLKLWSGLGYNRRAKFLHESAKILARDGWTGEKLPGVGPYTAAAVEAFAHNKPTTFIETNIRTVFIHYCFKRRADVLVPDLQILPLIEKALKQSRMQPRDFYAALMDYGSYLKQRGIKLNARSKHYTKQSKFKGSYRELRGAILRAVLEKPKTIDQLVDITLRNQSDVVQAVANLSTEGVVSLKNKRVFVAD
ncbi:MAG TPA: A/G-specific adenine glycosylase [Candidatus Paceibacterota bacterium]|nr:A/G-specific adenine glycosylase [Candidatus Paceibacterota bacterium]